MLLRALRARSVRYLRHFARSPSSRLAEPVLPSVEELLRIVRVPQEPGQPSWTVPVPSGPRTVPMAHGSAPLGGELGGHQRAEVGVQGLHRELCRCWDGIGMRWKNLEQISGENGVGLGWIGWKTCGVGIGSGQGDAQAGSSGVIGLPISWSNVKPCKVSPKNLRACLIKGNATVAPSLKVTLHITDRPDG